MGNKGYNRDNGIKPRHSHTYIFTYFCLSWCLSTGQLAEYTNRWINAMWFKTTSQASPGRESWDVLTVPLWSILVPSWMFELQLQQRVLPLKSNNWVQVTVRPVEKQVQVKSGLWTLTDLRYVLGSSYMVYIGIWFTVIPFYDILWASSSTMVI